MTKFRQNDAEKVAFGIAGLAGGTLAMKTIEKVSGSPAVKGLLGFEGVATLKEIVPSLAVGLLGTTFFAKNKSKNIGYVGLGAAMAAGARVVEKVSNKTLFSGLGSTPEFYVADQPAIEGGEDYYEMDGLEGDDELDDIMDGLEGDDDFEDFDGLEGDEDFEDMDGLEGNEDFEDFDGLEGDDDFEDFDGLEGDDDFEDVY